VAGRLRGPEAPRNVRLELPDGTVLPLELFYDGCDDDGTHVWKATQSVPVVWAEGVHLRCDRLPPRTAISVPMEEEE